MPRRANKRKRKRDGTIAAEATRESSSPPLDFMFDEQVVTQNSPQDADYVSEEDDPGAEKPEEWIYLAQESDEQANLSVKTIQLLLCSI